MLVDEAKAGLENEAIVSGFFYSTTPCVTSKPSLAIGCEQALKRVSYTWASITNTDPYHLMIAMIGSSSMNDYMQAMDARLASAGRLRIKLWMARHAIKSKLRYGHIMLNGNLGS